MATACQSIFIHVIGAPFESELSTTLLRMVDAGLDQGLRITVWTCGGATTLTHQGLGAMKPRNLIDLAEGQRQIDYPTTLTLIRGLLAKGEGRLNWYVCRHCMEERGVSEQMDGVKVQYPFKFVQLYYSFDTSIIIGIR